MIKSTEVNLVVRGRCSHVLDIDGVFLISSWHWIAGREFDADPKDLGGVEVEMVIGDKIVATSSLLSLLQPRDAGLRQRRMLEDLAHVVRALTVQSALHLPPGFFADALVAQQPQLIRIEVAQGTGTHDRALLPLLDLRCILRGHRAAMVNSGVQADLNQ